MKKIVFYFVFLFTFLGFVNGETLVTKSYIIQIINNCAEGNVSCDDISYVGKRKSDGTTLQLTGKTLNKKNTLDLYGYVFKNGSYSYYIYINEAEFFIEKEGRLIASEKGSWEKILLNDTSTKEQIENNCKELSFKDVDGNLDIYRSGTTCFYPNKKLLEVYTDYRQENLDNEDGKHLREKIPTKNDNDIIEKGYLEIKYNWISSKELKIEQWFSGGMTTLNFKEKDNGTEMTTIYDAD